MAAKRKAEKRPFIDSKKADEAAVQEQRCADCERIDAEARRLLKQSVWSEAFGYKQCLTGALWVRDADGVPTTSPGPQGPQGSERYVEATTLVSFDIGWQDYHRETIVYEVMDGPAATLDGSGRCWTALRLLRRRAIPQLRCEKVSPVIRLSLRSCARSTTYRSADPAT